MSAQWTDERVNLLKSLWKQGYTARKIAEKLGGGVTRNAVIGKAHRMGLSAKPQPTKRRLAPSPGTIDRSCQWPIGDPGDRNFKLCGEKAMTGKPYCQFHCSIAYRRIGEEEQSA